VNEKQSLPIKFAESVEFIIPKFYTRPAIPLRFNDISEGERRLVEAKAVNGATYADLEFSFNEGYREAKTNLSVVGYEITQAEKKLRSVKSEYLLDTYPEFLREKKLKDNAAIRDAYLERQTDYVETKDRIDMLKALENLLEGKVKVFENVCRYMRKEMDILIRSGMTGNKYTSNK